METAQHSLRQQELYWQKSQWQEVIARVQNGTLPHALLLAGDAGLGKGLFAETLAAVLLCEQSQAGEQDACGRCHSCAMIQMGSHPDLLYITPQEDGKAITVDQIREMGRYLSLKSHGGGYRVVVVNPAENMNRFAANSLLKTLEEPGEGTVILLVSHQTGRLLPTIRSRCQSIQFKLPPAAALQQWLQQGQGWDPETVQSLVFLAHGSPLQALNYGHNGALTLAQQVLTDFQAVAALRQDPVSVAKKWLDQDVSAVCQWLISWTMMMIRLKSCGQVPDNKAVTDQLPLAKQLQMLSEKVHLKALFAYFDKVTECYRLLNSQVNTQLMLEDLLIYWRRINTVTT
ncbi:MAG: DNA polymerase III subunit delta' [Gammaproteobacteria bacterium]|nr:DNA polymerase III subunit delta' [Gammaproteobacteria bacterium]MDH5799380.1 DNA polymerase III subunit delta' [Gammaproteobacteria bacterium]